MLLRRNAPVFTLILSLVLGFTSCAEDQKATEEPITASSGMAADSTAGEDVGFSSDAIYFAFDDFTLSTEAQDRLNALSNEMKSSGSAVVQIEGHCDERGSIEYNLALGERRAESVKSYLVRLGVDANRVTTISYGEERPAAMGHDEGSWSKNRRAEFNMSN